MIQDFSCLEYINSSHQPKPTQFKDIKPELILRHTCNFRYRRYSGTGTCAPWVPVWWTKAVPVHISATPNGKVTWYLCAMKYLFGELRRYRYIFPRLPTVKLPGTGTYFHIFDWRTSAVLVPIAIPFWRSSAVPLPVPVPFFRDFQRYLDWRSSAVPVPVAVRFCRSSAEPVPVLPPVPKVTNVLYGEVGSR